MRLIRIADIQAAVSANLVDGSWTNDDAVTAGMVPVDHSYWREDDLDEEGAENE